MSSGQAPTGPGFQTPREVTDPRECLFYHTMDLPGLGLQVGAWDLRANVDAYLGNQSYAGKHVVDVGTASGYLCFEMERRGANVIAFDRTLTDEPTDDMGLVPFHDCEAGVRSQRIQKEIVHQRQMQDSFWLAHRLLRSRARLFCGTAYECPAELGEFDYAFFGAILLHLRDPLQAIGSFARRALEKVIITEPLEDIGACGDAPVMFFRPNVADRGNVGTWWYLTPALLQRYLEILGFRSFSIVHHTATFVLDGNKQVPYFSLVASRSPRASDRVSEP